MTCRGFWLSFLLPSLLVAQQAPANSLEDISIGVSGPLTDETKQYLFESIQRTGIDFPLDEQALATIVESSRQGKQTDAFTAHLIAELLHACVGCRDRYFGALTMPELLTLVKRQIPPQVIIEEVRQRGTKDIPKTIDTIRQFTVAGASPGLIALVVPDHELEIQTPADFTRLALVRAPSFNPASPVGLLELTVGVAGKAEFRLVNNALFARSINGPSLEKKDDRPLQPLASSITAPGPNTNMECVLVSFDYQEDTKKGIVKIFDRGTSLVKGAKRPNVEFAANLAAGRPGCKITIDESDKKIHMYKLVVQWNKPAAN